MVLKLFCGVYILGIVDVCNIRFLGVLEVGRGGGGR